jgi:hypothetical protein
MIGYISHGLLDLANLEGVALTYPLFPHHRWVFPGDGAYRVKANSSREQALRIVGTLLMTGLLALNLAGGRALFHSFLGTPAAIARDHASQLKHDRRLLVRVEGVWTRGQSRVSGRFEVIGSTDVAIFVRRPAEPMKVYQIGGDFSAISHPRLKIVRRLKAQQRVVTVKFSGERWREDLVAQYPNALVIGSVKTRASPPVFEPDEFPTILRFGDRWELTHAPIELVDKVLRPPRAKLTGNIQIRYWLKRGSDEHNKDHS